MATLKCEKCGKVMDEKDFYTYKDGRKTELCKKCLTMHIDAFDPDTFMWLLEKMDVPYIPAEWDSIKNKSYEHNPLKFNSMAVFGKYLSKMKLKQYKQYCWADGPRLIQEAEEKAENKVEEAKERDNYYQEKFENGEINENEYKTLTSTNAQKKARDEALESAAGQNLNNPYLGPNNPYDESNYIDEDLLPNPAADLTDEDKIYLATKWGRMYQPSEWVMLETDYEKMTRSFDIQDADTENALILICKANLKMNQFLDNGDIDGFQKISKVSESLRKSAKFTAAQNKEEKGEFVDCIGELIRICEKDGFIPRFVTDIPQDVVDKTLQDQENYIRNLVTKELGLGQQIEDSLKKIELQKQMEEEERMRAEKEGDDYDPYYSVNEIDNDDDAELNEVLQKQLENDDKIYKGEN